MGVFFEAEGFSRTAGRIFGRLLLSEGPLSLDQLVADLGASKASISTETRLLERRGVLERVGRAGDRRVYYQVIPELPLPTLELRLERMRRFSGLVIEARRELADRGSPLIRQRLDYMVQAYRYILAALSAAIDQWSSGHRPPARRTRGARRSR